MVNTPVEARVTKNSAVLTVPIVILGVSPLPINVVETTGPHPPPPEASTKPPNKPKTVYCLNFLAIIFFRTALNKIRKPINSK